ncbi:DNA ligase D [Halalkalibacter sp. APA_J-10(15)]|uniref:DNA ligase D n=1 Tax=Halalkalibacter sp. APA_J-10(15) TaxID=2933805 RepID=UPI001FF5E4F2|nr:DNA ligase D [Halalkalibacter sp. APA_J-10(15)]MCK0469918.1 DNA ligase D [Halalkalibacter sp. APA_J-10(15)]
MKPMRLTTRASIPTGDNWIYEAKYDGFRCMLQWKQNRPTLLSRTGRLLNKQFPEIIDFCLQHEELISPYLPLLLDGEIVYLTHSLVSDFTIVQNRGRLRNQTAIDKQQSHHPCHFLAFDLLIGKGEIYKKQPLFKRKERLSSLFQKATWPLTPSKQNDKRIQLITYTNNHQRLWSQVTAQNGEGMIAKHRNSQYEEGIRTTQWLKIKHWRIVTVVLSHYDRQNGYFRGNILKGEQWIEVVHFKHGLSKKEEAILASFFQKQGQKVSTEQWKLEPAICVDVACIDFDGKHLREPTFHQFQFDSDPLACTWKQMQRQLHPIPESISITHADKPIFPKLSIDKDEYILYLQKVAPALLPFLKNRCLTLIRYPHGVEGESFYQKQCPNYAPDFIETRVEEGIDYIVCNDVHTLLWLGNQLALEFHIPFQTIDTNQPTEIVFDLDPPTVRQFHLAITAAKQMKEVFDQFGLYSYVKTSGGKGLQLYLPIANNQFTYEETRLFTKFIATYLCEQNPALFTTERLKKKRDKRLYVDYIQHDVGKTIISPFSPRGHADGLVATPLWWHEVNENLTPHNFDLFTVIERIKEGNPFESFFAHKDKQPLRDVISELKKRIN